MTMARKASRKPKANGADRPNLWPEGPPSELELAVFVWLGALGDVRKAQARVEKLIEDQNILDFDRRVQRGFERLALRPPAGGESDAGVAR